MADILCLKGDAAFSAFRLQRLTNRLTAAVADIEAVVADYWHVVAQKRPLDADERQPLGAYNHPPWWVERLRLDWPRHWQAILQSANEHPPMTLRVNVRRCSGVPLTKMRAFMLKPPGASCSTKMRARNTGINPGLAGSAARNEARSKGVTSDTARV